MAFLAPLAFGTAATATTAATAGLFGTAGSFALGTTLATVGTGLAIGGALKSGQSESQAAEYNAQTAVAEAQIEENRRRTEASRAMGALRAGISKSGVTMEGTPLMVLAESAANAEIDALNAQWTGQRQAQSQLMRGSAAQTASYYRAGTSLMSGLAKVA